MNLSDWKLVAAIPPLLVWFGLFGYLLLVESKLRKAQARLTAPDSRDGADK